MRDTGTHIAPSGGQLSPPDWAGAKQVRKRKGLEGRAGTDDTRAWLARAHEDLRGAEVDLTATPPLLGDATFHCQQAAEKTRSPCE